MYPKNSHFDQNLRHFSVFFLQTLRQNPSTKCMPSLKFSPNLVKIVFGVPFIILFYYFDPPPLKGSDQCFDPLLNCTFFIWSMACSCLYIRILAIASNYHTWHIKFDLLKVIDELKWSYKCQVPFFRNDIMWDILFHGMYYSNYQSHKIKAISWSLTILKAI